MVGCSLVSPWRIQTDPNHKEKLTKEWLIEDWKPVPSDEELLAFTTLFNMAMWEIDGEPIMKKAKFYMLMDYIIGTN